MGRLVLTSSGGKCPHERSGGLLHVDGSEGQQKRTVCNPEVVSRTLECTERII